MDFMWKHCGWTSLQDARTDLILCDRPVDGWHVRCWCRLKEAEKAGETSPQSEILKFWHSIELHNKQLLAEKCI